MAAQFAKLDGKFTFQGPAPPEHCAKLDGKFIFQGPAPPEKPDSGKGSTLVMSHQKEFYYFGALNKI